METDVEDILKASEKIGYDKDVVLRDAVNMFLAANKEFREKIVMELYKDGRISLGKAAEIAGLSYERMKTRLRENDIPIQKGPESAKELRKKSEELLRMV